MESYFLFRLTNNDGAASMKSLTENSEEVLHGKELDEKIL